MFGASRGYGYDLSDLVDLGSSWGALDPTTATLRWSEGYGMLVVSMEPSLEHW